MVLFRHARHWPQDSLAQAGRRPCYQTSDPKEKTFCAWMSGHHQNRNRQDIRGRIHRRGSTLSMAYQCHASNKEREEKMDGLHRLYRPQQSMPEWSYPVPRIDLLVDSTSRNQLLSFLYAYSGYNQIAMHEPDKEKITFVIEQGTYCYKVMPFDLQNVGAT